MEKEQPQLNFIRTGSNFMGENFIDKFIFFKKKESKTLLVKILVFGLVLLLLFFRVEFKEFIYLCVVQFFDFRQKYPFEINISQIISTLVVSTIPLSTYWIWIKIRKQKNLVTYLSILFLSFSLFVLFFALGLELMIQTAVDIQKENPLLPSYILIPRFPFSFDLLVILSGIMSILSLKLIYRNKKNTTHTNNT